VSGADAERCAAVDEADAELGEGGSSCELRRGEECKRGGGGGGGVNGCVDKGLDDEVLADGHPGQVGHLLAGWGGAAGGPGAEARDAAAQSGTHGGTESGGAATADVVDGREQGMASGDGFKIGREAGGGS
jgi:hypothetical protein